MVMLEPTDTTSGPSLQPWKSERQTVPLVDCVMEKDPFAWQFGLSRHFPVHTLFSLSAG